MDGRVPDDAPDLAPISKDHHPAATRIDPVRPTDAVDPQKTVLRDVADHVADFVGVRFDHHRRCVRLGPLKRAHALP